MPALWTRVLKSFGGYTSMPCDRVHEIHWVSRKKTCCMLSSGPAQSRGLVVSPIQGGYQGPGCHDGTLVLDKISANGLLENQDESRRYLTGG